MTDGGPVLVEEPPAPRPRGPRGDHRAPRPYRLGGVMASGWLPAALVTAVAVLLLRFYGVPAHTTAIFASYLLAGVVLPGTLLWRALRGGSGWFTAEVAAGAALGYALEVAGYIPARAIGAPLLVLLFPVATVATFLAVPRLRRYWRTAPDADRAPAAWNWSMAGIAALILFWSVKFYRVYGLSWPYNSAPDTDSTFHLALLGEAKHHMPMVVPWVSGEPLYYHWFVYAEMAATSWVTGIEPQLLLLRLSPLPMLVVFAVLIAVLARRLFGQWWTGVAATAGTLFVLAPDPYGWQLDRWVTGLAFSNIDDGSSLRTTVWTGPTQTFGAMLFAAVMLVLVELLVPTPGRTRGRWVLFTVLVGAVMGGKATYLPVLLAGLLLVVAASMVPHRRPHRPALAALGIVAVFLAFAQLVLFGGTSQGVAWQPLQSMATSGIALTTGFGGTRVRWQLVVLALLAAWCYLCIWAGISGLFRRGRLSDPRIRLLVGVGVAGMGATSLLGQRGDSQRLFLEAARPYLSLAAVGGLVALVGAARGTRRTAAGLIGAALAGMVLIGLVRLVDGSTVPRIRRTGSWQSMAGQLAWPYIVTVVLAVVAAVALVRLRRRRDWPRGTGHALVVALLAGFGLATSYSDFALIVRQSASQGWRDVVQGKQLVTGGTLEAGRWLRDHSSPDDIVATNAHCLRLASDPRCTDLHFSMSAYSERRMLVEGWGFTTTAHETSRRDRIWDGYVPYWDQEKLAANDAVFYTPSEANVAQLRTRYKVRWLFVDDTQGSPSPELTRYATLRYRSGDCSVYELNRGGS